jgi:hypothetical protein
MLLLNNLNANFISNICHQVYRRILLTKSQNSCLIFMCGIAVYYKRRCILLRLQTASVGVKRKVGTERQ